MSDYQVANNGLCGECRHHKYITDAVYDFIGFQKEEFICTNKNSDKYDCMREYTDTCECFEQEV